MTLTDSEHYYLARFLSDKYDISLERASEVVQDPEVESWTDHEFVSNPLRFDHKTDNGSYSEEFLERENQLYVMTKAYCRNSPLYAEDYLDLVQVTPEKETELDMDLTQTWYEESQVGEIVGDLRTLVDWLQNNLYTEHSVPDDNKYAYDLNLSLMLYGLDNSESRISVDYMNGHHTLRSSPHTRGYVSENTYSNHARSVGMRLASTFNGDKDKEIEDIEGLSDEIVDALAPYYEGPIRQLVRKVEDSLTLHNESE